MEDEKIIGLYWERNEDAITETSSKYGKLFFRIASNILPLCARSAFRHFPAFLQHSFLKRRNLLSRLRFCG